MMRPVRWYCPPGVAKPKHAIVPGCLACMPNAGPPGAPPGGMCYGAPIEPGEAGWMPHPDGHWFNLTDAQPAILIRLDTHPRLVRWHDVAGATTDHLWRVPVLLSPVYCDGTGSIIRFDSALDRVWNGAGWDTPAEIQSVQRRLLSAHYAVGTGQASLSSDAAVQVAIDVLQLGQEFDPYEVVAAGWVTEVLVVRVLLAAVDMELGG